MKVASTLAWACVLGTTLVFSIGCAGAPGASTAETASGVSQSADGGSGIESDADYRAAKRVVDEDAAHLRAVVAELKAAAGDRAKLEEIKKAHSGRLGPLERAPKETWELSEAKGKRLRAYTHELLLPLKREVTRAWRWAKEFQLGAGERHQPELSMQGIGARLEHRKGHTIVTSLVPGGPAAREGTLDVNDEIIAVAQGDEGAPVDIVGMPIRDVIELIRGAKGTKAMLTVLRGDDKGETLVVVIVRDTVQLVDAAEKMRWETVVKGYPGWFWSFHSDFTRFAERAKQKTPLTGAEIDTLFASSIRPGSKMTSVLAMFDAKGHIEGSGAEPGYAGMATVLLMLLGNSSPASFGGAVSGEHGDRIYMQLLAGTANSYSDRPIPRVTDRVEYPHLIFQVQGDKLLLTAISREFAAVMHKSWQRQML